MTAVPMSGQFLVGRVEIGLVVTWVGNSRFGVVRDDCFGHTAEKFKSTAVGADPGKEVQGQGYLGVGIVAGSQCRYENAGGPGLTIAPLVV